MKLTITLKRGGNSPTKTVKNTITFMAWHGTHLQNNKNISLRKID